MSDELKENVKNSSAWMRLLFMLLFAVLYSVAEMVLTVVVIFQFLAVLITGKKNAKVLSLGAQLATYAYQVFSYLTYNSEERPFPFADWPNDRPLGEMAAAAATAAKTGKGAARRGRPGKAAAKAELKPDSEVSTPENPPKPDA